MIVVGAVARRWNVWKWPNGYGQGYGESYKRMRNVLVPYRVRSTWGGWWPWFVGHVGPGALRSLGYRIRYRTVNRVKDVAAVSLGWCNFSPWRAGLERGRLGPAYSHWRCRYRRHPAGTPHRFINYTCGDDGNADYDPLSVDGTDPGWRDMPRWLRDRHGCARLREQRMHSRILRAEVAKVRDRVRAEMAAVPRARVLDD